MEKINKTLTKDYITAKFFLEDLVAIQEVINESAESFEIKTNEFKFQAIEELKQKYNNQKISNIEISSRNPYISIELRRISVRLYCASDDIKSSGLFYKLDTIIAKTSRKPNFLYSYPFYFSGFVFIFLISNIIGENNKAVFGTIGVLLILWYMWVGYIRLFNSGVAVLSNRGDFESFFSRNKDQIIVAIITVVATTYVPLLLK